MAMEQNQLYYEMNNEEEVFVILNGAVKCVLIDNIGRNEVTFTFAQHVYKKTFDECYAEAQEIWDECKPENMKELFVKWYSNNSFQPGFGCTVQAETLMEWIFSNKEQLSKFIEEEETD